jgi:hypothetical protein
MTDVMSTEVDTVSVTEPEMPPALADAVDEQLVGRLVERARASGNAVQLGGPGGCQGCVVQAMRSGVPV